MMCGFDGLSSTNSGALPELILAAFRALQKGDAGAARDLHRLWYPYRAFARQVGQPQCVKAAMSLRGWNGGSVRAPLANLNAAETAALHSVLQALATDRRTEVSLPEARI
jgi:dihydrodipicolinate synthase/N-acetylneuraminate lyase